jgi:hypothetical protein
VCAGGCEADSLGAKLSLLPDSKVSGCCAGRALQRNFDAHRRVREADRWTRSSSGSDTVTRSWPACTVTCLRPVLDGQAAEGCGEVVVAPVAGYRYCLRATARPQAVRLFRAPSRFVQPSSARPVEPVRRDSSFAEKQESYPALLLVVPSESKRPRSVRARNQPSAVVVVDGVRRARRLFLARRGGAGGLRRCRRSTGAASSVPRPSTMPIKRRRSGVLRRRDGGVSTP